MNDYKVIRSARKTISISVSSLNEIIVRCPLHISESRLKNFIDNKREWIEKIISENSLKINENRAVTEYKEIYVSGIRLPLVISDKNAITDSAVYIKDLKNIKNIYIKRFSDCFIEEVHKLSESTGLKACTVNFKSYKSRWGCCDRNNNLIFNYKLFMLPLEIQRYVIIHELCHTVHFNHSKSFWRLVGRFLPDYKKLKSELKSYDFIVKLY